MVPERVVLRVIKSCAADSTGTVPKHAHPGGPAAHQRGDRACGPRPNNSPYNHGSRRSSGRNGDGIVPDGQSTAWEFASLLRMLIQPYLNQGRPDVAFAAELAGISTRTLQRRLALCGSSYSQILQEARFQLACMRLGDPALKVIDVAMMVGYGCPQHFTRAFRRFGGITPSEYRQHNLDGDSHATQAAGSAEQSPL